MSSDMAQTELETQPLSEEAQASVWFACPSCGSMLRKGAIVCPACEADLWYMKHGGPAPSQQAGPEAAGEVHAPASAEERRAKRSVTIAAVALGAELVLPLVAAVAEQLSLLWSVLGWVGALVAVYAISLARKIERDADVAERRVVVMSRYGLILGMASLAVAASVLITSTIDRVIGNLQ